MAVLPGVSVHVSELIYSFFKPWYAGIVHYNLLVARPSEQRSDEELTLETSASESLYGGQFTLSTQLIKPNYLDLKPGLRRKTGFKIRSVFLCRLFPAEVKRRALKFKGLI